MTNLQNGFESLEYSVLADMDIHDLFLYSNLLMELTIIDWNNDVAYAYNHTLGAKVNLPLYQRVLTDKEVINKVASLNSNFN